MHKYGRLPLAVILVGAMASARYYFFLCEIKSQFAVLFVRIVLSVYHAQVCSGSLC